MMLQTRNESQSHRVVPRRYTTEMCSRDNWSSGTEDVHALVRQSSRSRTLLVSLRLSFSSQYLLDAWLRKSHIVVPLHGTAHRGIHRSLDSPSTWLIVPLMG